MADGLFTQVNRHCADAIVRCSQSHRICAHADIVDADSGVMLWARGKPVTTAMYERLVRRRLREPLEASLTIEDGVNARQVLDEADAQLQADPALQALAQGQIERVMPVLRGLRVPGPMRLLLTAARQTDPATVPHAVNVMLLATLLGARAGFDDRALAATAAAALVHDLGQLYLGPHQDGPSRALTPEQWRRIALHPRIGRLLVEELTDYGEAVAAAVGQHHERLDGSGYPAKARVEAIGRPAQALLVAEAIAGLLGQPNGHLRAQVAVRLVFREFPDDLTSGLTVLNGRMPLAKPETLDLMVLRDEVTGALIALDAAVRCARQLAEDTPASPLHELLERCFAILAKLYSSSASTGVAQYLQQFELDGEEDAALVLVLAVLPYEIRWRMRAMARELAVAMGGHPHSCCESLDRLHGLLAA